MTNVWKQQEEVWWWPRATSKDKTRLKEVYLATIPSYTPLIQYVRDLPLCNELNYHHVCACREQICKNYGRKCHTIRFCISPNRTPNQGTVIDRNCKFYKCGETCHFKRVFPKLANQWGNAQVIPFFIGTRNATQDPLLEIYIPTLNDIIAIWTIELSTRINIQFLIVKKHMLLFFWGYMSYMILEVNSFRKCELGLLHSSSMILTVVGRNHKVEKLLILVVCNSICLIIR